MLEGHLSFKLSVPLSLSPGCHWAQVCFMCAHSGAQAERMQILGESFLVATADMQEGKPNHTSTFQFSAANMSAKLPLANQVTWVDLKSRFSKVQCTHREDKPCHVANSQWKKKIYYCCGGRANCSKIII